jgi:taurine dioxygenase
MNLTVKRLSPALGAEIKGVDLSRALDPSVVGEIADAWHENLLVIFRGQTLTPDQHIEFSRHFGGLEIHPNPKHLHREYPVLLNLTNRLGENGEALGLKDGGSDWHSDLSYMKAPSKGSLLYALEVPKIGGDTEWGNMYKAYETLPEATKARIADLRAIHQFDHNANPRLTPPEGVIAGQEGSGSIWDKKSAATKARTPNVPHPIVRIHPDTGRKALFVNRRFTIAVEDMDAEQGENLLLELFDHCEQPEFIYRHKWRVGDLLMWDNRCTIHVACGGFNLPEIRQMYRTTLTGAPTH